MKESVVPSVHYLNIGNLHDTGHSASPTSTAAMADFQPFAVSQRLTFPLRTQ